MKKRQCKNCKIEFLQERTNQVYCGDSCKTKAYRKRQKTIDEINGSILEISLSKYQEVVKMEGCVGISIEKFGFFTHNLDESFNAEQIALIINNLELTDKFETHFKDFLAKFHVNCRIIP